ncbi:hypothetical protein GNF82_13590 [Clostridium perfringens]
MVLKVGMCATTMGGKKIICFEATEKFAFFAPYEEEEGKMNIDLSEVLVYNNEDDSDDHTPISSLSIGTK